MGCSHSESGKLILTVLPPWKSAYRRGGHVSVLPKTCGTLSLSRSHRKRWLSGNKRARSYPESSKLIFAVLHKPWGSVFGQAGSAREEDPSLAVAPSTVFKDSLRVAAGHPGVGQEGYSLVSRSAHWRRHQLHKAM